MLKQLQTNYLVVHGGIWRLRNLNTKLALLRSSVFSKRHERIQHQNQQLVTKPWNKRPSTLLEILRGLGGGNRDSLVLSKILSTYENHKVVHPPYVFWGEFWQYRKLDQSFDGVRGHPRLWWGCSARGVRAAVPEKGTFSVPDGAGSLGALRSASYPGDFRGGRWATAPLPRAARKSDVSPFLSGVWAEKPGTFPTWLRDGTFRGSDPVGQTQLLSNCTILSWPYLLLWFAFS